MLETIVGFFEVNTTSRSIDFGTKLPLRHTERPNARNWVYLLQGSVLFHALPIAYLADEADSWAEVLGAWPVLLVVAFWTFLFVIGVSRALVKVQHEVNPMEVIRRSTGALREDSWVEPMERYRGLQVALVHHPDWIGNKLECGVELVHESDPARSIMLYWGRSSSRAAERIQTQANLLGKPIL